MSDWIKVHRRLLDSDVFANQTTLKIWVWLLLKAHYKDKVVSIKTGKGYEDVTIKRGKVLFGRNTAEEKLKISASCIYRHIKKLEKIKKITVKSNNHYSIITICKYELYQSVKDETEQPTGQPLTQPMVQPMVGAKNTNKNIKNIQEGKEGKEEGEIAFFWDSEKSSFLNAGDWVFKFCTDKRIAVEVFDDKAKEFISDLELKGDFKPLKEIRNHFTNWYNKKSTSVINGNRKERELSDYEKKIAEDRERAKTKKYEI